MASSSWLDGEQHPTRTEPEAFPQALDSATLGILWVSPEERFHELEAGGSLGRAADCALRLEGQSVSRQHARIEKDGPVWMIRDLGSKNGTFVNGRRRELAPLSLQDTVRAGDWVGVLCSMPRSELTSQRFFQELLPGVTLSAPTLAALSNLAALSAENIPVIVQGETGSGKEVLARAIHQHSGRRGPLIAINCAAIPDGIAEAELFGYKKGAFTGALEASRGRIAAANQGTLFLDEIVELSPAIQSKLLRVLEECAVTPLGTTESVPVDFRLIAASQEALEKLVQSGDFRADLYARLNGAELRLPALRERRQEVYRLLREALQQALGWLPPFHPTAVERLCLYAWPYNVRELCQLARLLSISGKAAFCLEDLPQRLLEPELPDGLPPSTPKAGANGASPQRQGWLARHSDELDRLKQALHQYNGNLSEAARATSIPRHRARRLLAAEAALCK
jgi:DNA-binding NtrC family response regulator